MPGQLAFYMSDLYPGMSFGTTRDESVPETEDQKVLLDDPAAGDKVIKEVDPKKHKKIFGTIIIMIAIIMVLSAKR